MQKLITMKPVLSEKEVFFPLPDFGLSKSTEPRFEIDSLGGLCLSSWWRREDGDVAVDEDDDDDSFLPSVSLSFLLLLLSRFELELEW